MKRISFFLVLLLLLSSALDAQRRRNKAPAYTPVDTSLYQGLKWRNIGPFRGGRSVACSGVVSDPMTYYMGGTGGGIWKTEDGGINWKNISDGQLATGSVGAIGVSESDPNVIFVGMGEHAVRGVMTSSGDGVYKSTDAGKTWTHVGLDKSMHISDVIIDPRDPDVVFHIRARCIIWSFRRTWHLQDDGWWPNLAQGPLCRTKFWCFFSIDGYEQP